VLSESPCIQIAYEMKKISVRFLRLAQLSILEEIESKSGCVMLNFYPEVSQTIRQHLEGICHYFMNRTTSGVMEGINKIKLIKRQGYGFVTLKTFD